jgi:hypothetical protein
MKLLFFPVTVIVACTTPGVLTPATGPGTSYPCGTHGVECKGQACCPEQNVCGGDDPSCPVGQCCFVGDGRLTPDGGRPTTPQRPMP